MVTDREEVAGALEGGLLASREVRELSTDWGRVFAIDVGSAELREAWGELRARMPELGRWPLATMSWDDGAVDEEIFARWLYGQEDNSPQAVCARARTVTLDDALRPHRERDQSWIAENWERIVEVELRQTVRRLGASPTLDEVLALDLCPDRIALDRWLLDWEEARQPTRAPDSGGYLDWFEPDNCSLLPLPTAASEEVLAYVSFYGGEGPGGHERWIALLRSWRERYGAEMVACWGTMLQLQVSAPPQTLDEAFELAVEQSLAAPCTTALPGVSIRDHARALMGRREWFIHERP
jgi:Domain of unknown function (DUF4253)